MSKQRLVILTGAGVSAESGVRTFRDGNGLWENHRIEDVATPEAWKRNPGLVLEFYNQRRRQAGDVSPNLAHTILAELEEVYDVHIITQNVDNLHERAGSTHVLHLHGELSKAQSTQNPSDIYDIKGWELNIGDLCAAGSQLRPHIVWFGEAVPMIEPAIDLVRQADIFIVIGTSLVVYPAAGLIHYTQPGVPVYVVDVSKPDFSFNQEIRFIQEKATVGMQRIKETLLATR